MGNTESCPVDQQGSTPNCRSLAKPALEERERRRARDDLGKL
jgi:hypothetical protein